MCVIAICEDGKKLTREVFHQCYDANDHGAGFAWIADGNINFAKGFMDEKLAWRVYKRICDFPHVAHFRLASAGDKCRELTHPFLITPESELVLNYSGQAPVLFHNGTVTNWKTLGIMVALARKKATIGKVSDTRIMAIATSMVGESALDIDSGKYVIATPGGFVTYGTVWSEKDGIKFSNLFFSFRSTYTYVNGGKGQSYIPGSYYLDEKDRVVRDYTDDETGAIDDIPEQLRGVNEKKVISGEGIKNEHRTYGRFFNGGK